MTDMRFRLDLYVEVQERMVEDKDSPYKYVITGSMTYQRGSEYGPWERVPFSNWAFDTINEDDVVRQGERIEALAKARAKEFKAYMDKSQEWAGRRDLHGAIWTVD